MRSGTPSGSASSSPKYCVFGSPQAVAKAAVLSALKLGYRHIDTAEFYANEAGVGRALAASGVARESVFITSKLNPGNPNWGQTVKTYETTIEACKESVRKLGVDKIDLYLVHTPFSGKEARIEQWRALVHAKELGLARSIGVSHYCKRHIDDILEVATVTPAINQVQFHVGMGAASPGGGANATDDREYDGTVGVTYQSFSPLCGPCEGSDHMELITGDLVTKIGKAHGKSGAQVALKWQVQQGMARLLPTAVACSFFLKAHLPLRRPSLHECVSPGHSSSKVFPPSSESARTTQRNAAHRSSSS